MSIKATQDMYPRRYHQVKIASILVAVIITVVMSVGLCALVPEAHAAPKSQASQKSQSAKTAKKETTSQKKVKESIVTLAAIGDNLVEDRIYDAVRKPDGTYDFSSLFAQIKPDIQASDIAVINQETMLVGGEPSSYRPINRWGTPRVDMARAIKNAGFNVVLHATNHTVDRDTDEVRDTLKYWRSTYPKIKVLGIHSSKNDAKKITVIKKNGIKIALLNYTASLNGQTSKIKNQRYLVDMLDKKKTASDVKSAKKLADFVVVFAHMGKEDVITPSSKAKKWTKYFADMGVDLMIGAHPHVLEPVTWIKGKGGKKMLAYYSVGNFASYQLRPDHVLGGMAKVVIAKSKKGVSVKDFKLVPLVCHADKAGSPVTVYKLSDYNDDLAKEHASADLSVASLRGWYTKITGFNSNLGQNKLIKVGKSLFAISSEATPLKGWVLIGEKLYYASSSGKCITGKTVEGIKLTSAGYAKTSTTKAKLMIKALKIVNKITTPSMTKKEKLTACWEYVQALPYYPDKDPDVAKKDWMYACALEMLSAQGGNCYGFASAFAALAKAVGEDPEVIIWPNLKEMIHAGHHMWVRIQGKHWDSMGNLQDADQGYYSMKGRKVIYFWR